MKHVICQMSQSNYLYDVVKTVWLFRSSSLGTNRFEYHVIYCRYIEPDYALQFWNNHNTGGLKTSSQTIKHEIIQDIFLLPGSRL